MLICSAKTLETGLPIYLPVLSIKKIAICKNELYVKGSEPDLENNEKSQYKQN